MDLLLGIIQYVWPFLLVLTVLVFVHELGHYLVARWNGVTVEVFSIGFGPEIFAWTDRRQTRWRIAWIPLGGYVKFLGDMNATSAPDRDKLGQLPAGQQSGAFHNKRVGQRMAIVLAGPMANFIYAIVVLAVLFATYGIRATPPIVGRVLPDSVAAASGFQVRDRILSINGRELVSFEELQEEVLSSPEQPLTFVIERQGRRFEIIATPKLIEVDIDGVIQRAGVIGLLPHWPATVGEVIKESAAYEAGLQPGDRITAVNGQAIENFAQLQKIVLASQGRTMTMAIEREGESFTLSIAARLQRRQRGDGSWAEYWLVGVRPATLPLVKLGPVDAVQESFRKSIVMFDRTFEYLGQMISGRRGTEDLGGVVRIAQYSGQAAKNGFESLIMISVLLSLNLGFINLLPIPVLDGGHMLFYVFEAIRGRPLTERMQEHALRFGFLVVLSLMVFVTWNDLVNLRVFEYIAGWFS